MVIRAANSRKSCSTEFIPGRVAQARAVHVGDVLHGHGNRRDSEVSEVSDGFTLLLSYSAYEESVSYNKPQVCDIDQ